MNPYFFKLWLPLQALTGYLIVRLLDGGIEFNWAVVIGIWVLIGPVGTGVGFHRLFSHRQFQTYRPIEILLAYLGTMSGYSPVIFWCTNHIFHHKTSDTKDDLSSPAQHGFMESFLWWRLRKNALNRVDLRSYCSRLLFRDSILKFISRWFFWIFWSQVVLLFLVGGDFLLCALVIAVQLEHFRLNAISSLSHVRLPLSYRNFETPDSSHNNLIIGLLSLGFGWHNNHHHKERDLSLSHRWWELDFEALVAKAISRRPINALMRARSAKSVKNFSR